MPKRSASSSGPSGSSVAAKRARMKKASTSSPQHGSKNYMRYGTSLYDRFLKQTSTGKMASKKTFHLRYKERNGPKAMRETDGKLYWIHPDNESNKYLVTEENFADAMKRCRHDYELARNKQPNARIPGMGAKEGFRKNVEPNNTHYDKDGEVMAKWTMSIYWGTDDSRGMSGTVNEYGYDFSNGKSVMTADDGYAYSKEDFGIEDVVREVVDLASSDDESGDEEDEESADDDEEDEESADDDEEDEESAAADEEDEESAADEEEDEDADEEDEDEQMEPVEATAEVPHRADLTVKQIKSIVPKAKGSKKKDVQRSAMQVATYAQVKALHKRLGFRENKNTQAVRANIARLWFAAQ